MSKQTLKKQVGKRIKILREELKLTQAKASERTESVSEKRWSDIESSRYAAGINVLAQIAKALEVELYELFLFEDAKTGKKVDKIIKVENQVGKLEKELLKLKKEVRTLRKSPE